MAEQPKTEVTLLRRSQGEQDAAADAAATPGAAKTVRRRTSKSQAPETPATPDPDERMRHVLSVLIWLSAVLLLLAIISYTPLDQANADVRVRDIFGLFTNDPAVAARADTTQNWLGLLGAFIANFLVNGTIGYATIAVPALVALWGGALFVGTGYRRVTRITLYTLGALSLVAGLFGTLQLITWMPHPAHEWSGAIGAFIAAVLSGLLGKVGSFLLLLAALAITLVYATNSDLKSAILRVRQYWMLGRQKLTDGANALAERRAATDAADTAEPATGSSTAAAIVDAAAENEPARMMRRMRTAPEPQRPPEEPRIARPAAPPADQPIAPRATEQLTPPRPQRAEPEAAMPDAPQAGPAAPPRMRDIPMPDALADAAVPAPHAAAPEADPMLTREAREAMLREQQAEAAKAASAGVELVHGAPTPPPPPAMPAAVVNRLTLNVQEGETDADLETADEGALIERLRDEQIRYVAPPIDLMLPQSEDADVKDDELKENGRILQEKLATFNIRIENLTVTPGPVVTLYEFVPAAGIKLSQIESLADDIALALKARGIRIIAPIPGKGTVGVEIPNHKPAMVRIRSVINTTKFREAAHRLPLALGKTTVGEVFCDDLSKMPHLLIAGATGSGKSVGINAILASLLYKMHPSDLKFVVIDPKKIELSQYKALRNHFLAKCPDIDEEIITNPQNSVIALKSLEMEMDRRYDILAKVGQRNIFDYNAKVAEGKYADAQDFHHVKLPYIVLILDELADLMITAAKEVEEPIARLAQLARAIGIHLIVATQRPSVDVITGVIKANFPARIAYQVASKIDSRTILDMNGAEQLLGNGDMLFLPGGQPKPLRLQNAFISTEEVEAICEHIGKQKGYTYPYMLPSVVDKNKKTAATGGGERDDLFDEAARLVVRHQQGSVSLIQRRLKVGYSRAARIVDELEMAGIVGPFDGSKARAVLLESEAELEAYL